MLAAAMICLVVGISDGDTLTARCGVPESYEQVRIRLAAIDAPEKAQSYGERSRQALAALCFRQEAKVVSKDTDRYGRTVADVECRGQDAGTAQVRAGMAMVYSQYATKGYSALFTVQASARAAHRGLWSDRAPTPPWEYRHGPAVAAQPDTNGCITGPRGGRYTISSSGHKHYGC